MSYDDTRLGLDGEAPRCPVCGRGDAVEINRSANRTGQGGLYCGACHTTFTGLAGEWSGNAERRRLRAETDRSG